MAETAPPAELLKDIVSVKEWKAVALWRWNIQDETCAICRSGIYELCIECAAEGSSNECEVVWGACNHAFHRHCITRWLNKKSNCPLCDSEWEMTRVVSNRN